MHFTDIQRGPIWTGPGSIDWVPFLSNNQQGQSTKNMMHKITFNHKRNQRERDSCAQSWAHLDEQFLQFSGLGFVTLGAFHWAYA